MPCHATFVCFLHAGGSPLSVSRLAAALPAEMGVIVANPPRGWDGDAPPRRIAEAADGCAGGLWADGGLPSPARLVFVGNSYGALLAYEVARRAADAGQPVERLIVSGFRSPVLPPAEAPLHRLPSEHLWTELTARYGALPGLCETARDPAVRDLTVRDPAVEASLRADLEACETYRHSHAGPLAVPIDVLQLCDDSSVSEEELAAWREVTAAPMRLIPHPGGHFPWASHPDAMAATLAALVGPGLPANAIGGDAQRVAFHNP